MPTGRSPPACAQWAGLAAVAVAAVVADQVTKYLVTSRLALDQSVTVVGPLTIHHVQNSGIAFGFFPDSTAAVVAVTSAAVIWMVIFFARSGARHPVFPAALGLLLGGSVSNLADRIRLGHVTDFVDLKYWPAFNLADTFIVVGVAVLLFAVVGADRAPERPRRPLDVAAADGHPVPVEAVGERLDRFLATHLGSRAAAERAVDGRRARRRAGTAQELPPRRRRDRLRAGRSAGGRPAATAGADDRLGGRAPAGDRQAGRARRPPGGGTCVRHARGRPRLEARRGRAGTARDRPPARPRHLGADGRRPRRGVAQAPVGTRSQARARAHLPGARPGAAALAHGPDRGADRPRPRRADADVARQRLTARCGDELRGRDALARLRACCACASRRGGCTRFASIWRRSTCP